MKIILAACLLCFQSISAQQVTPSAWWYSTNTTSTLGSLSENFKPKVKAFMDAFAAAGAPVTFTINGGRSPAKHYLMYWSWQIAKEGYRKSTHPKPPPFGDMDVDWFWLEPRPTDFHPYAEKFDVPDYVGAALWMVEHYGLARKPKPTCKLVEGTAVNLALPSILEKMTLGIRGKDGKSYIVNNNIRNPNLIALAASFGLFPVHDGDQEPYYWQGIWSDDGAWD